jgi:hypothetical protein
MSESQGKLTTLTTPPISKRKGLMLKMAFVYAKNATRSSIIIL